MKRSKTIFILLFINDSASRFYFKIVFTEFISIVNIYINKYLYSE